MRLPSKLAFTAFHLAVAGTLACSAKTDHETAHATDAAPDVLMEAADDRPMAPDVADSGANDVATQDAIPAEASTLDAPADAASDGDDGCAANYYCGASTADASCPGPVCDLSECPLDAGCEPFV